MWAALHPGQPGYTFESDAPSIRIDYVWANPALAPLVSAIDQIAAQVGERGARASDHLGLLVTLEL